MAKERLTCSVAATEASAHPIGSSGVGWPFSVVPHRGESLGFVTPVQDTCRGKGRRGEPWGRQHPSISGKSQRGTEL